MPIAATVIGDDGMGTVLAARDVAAESRRAAALDGAHHLHLGKAHVAAVGFTPSGAGRGRYPRPPEQAEPRAPGGYAGGFSVCGLGGSNDRSW